MTQEALKLALDWAEAHGEIVFAGGGMSAVNKMNSWVAAIKEALAKEKTLQALHSENERLGLYKDAYAQPNTITFHNSNADWVMRITVDSRIEVNEDVEVTEAAQKVLDAMQYLLKAQRTWVGLTEEEIKTICVENGWDSSWQSMRFAHAIKAKLKERNT